MTPEALRFMLQDNLFVEVGRQIMRGALEELGVYKRIEDDETPLDVLGQTGGAAVALGLKLLDDTTDDFTE